MLGRSGRYPWERFRTHAKFLIEEGDYNSDDHLRAVTMSPSSLTLQGRIDVLYYLLHMWPTGSEVCDVLGSCPIDDRLFHITTPGKLSLLHLIARLLEISDTDPEHSDLYPKLIQQGVKAGANLHARDARYRRTPLIHALCHGSGDTNFLHAWLQELLGAGVDLYEYGKEEKRFLLDMPSWSWDILRRHESPFAISFLSYGSQLCDWRFWPKHPGDELVGIFWDMIEHPERSLPGAWEEGSPDLDLATEVWNRKEARKHGRRQDYKQHASLHPYSSHPSGEYWEWREEVLEWGSKKLSGG